MTVASPRLLAHANGKSSERTSRARERGRANASVRDGSTRGFAADAASIARDKKDDKVVVDLDAKLGVKASAKVQAIADQVCALTLIEVNELCDTLAERLGLGDVSGMMFGGGMMGGGGGGGGGAVAASAPAAAVVEKTEFTVKLASFDAAQKIKVIKEVRAITELGLKEAKELVEGTPAVLKKDIKKADAEAIVEKLKAVGGVVVLE